MRWIALLCVAAWAALGGLGPSAAQEATPEVIPASLCTVEPYSLEDLQAILATPTAASPEAAASPVAVALPAGEPADAATAEAVTGTMLELVACINAGDFLRILAIFGDDLVRESLAGEVLSQEFYDAFAQIEAPEPGQETVIYEVSEVVITENGRAAILVTGDDLSEPGGPSTTLFYLVEVDGRWQVDETVVSDDE